LIQTLDERFPFQRRSNVAAPQSRVVVPPVTLYPFLFSPADNPPFTMFRKLSALLLALPFILALQLNPPTGQVRSSSPLTISWTPASGVEVTSFDLYVANDNLRSRIALANNVTVASGSISVVLPSLPAGDGYSIRASNVGNADSVLSQTTTFNITDPISSSSLSNSSTSGISASSSSRNSISTSGISSTIPRTSGGGTSTRTSDTNSPTVAFNGNGALGVTGIGATVVGLLVAAGTFWAL